MCKSQEKIDQFLQDVGIDEPISREDFKNAVDSAIQDRALIFYFIYKTLQKLHPELDAEEVMAQASWDYGIFKGQSLKEVKNASDGMLNQTSKTGMIVFDQELTNVSEDYAEKVIRNCPLVNAFKRVGCDQEEITKLCTKMLMPADYAMLAAYPQVKLEFPKNLAEDDVCLMCVKAADK